MKSLRLFPAASFATGAAIFLAAVTILPLPARGSELQASDGAGGDLLGESGGLSGTSAIFGAPADDDNGLSSGSAYLFRNLDLAGATKTQDTKLTASDAAASDAFGFSAAISGTNAIVGAYADDDNGSASGSAYLFRNLDTAGATKTQDTKLTASDGAAVDNFGIAVAISGTNAIIGARLDDDNGTDSGSAYLFRNLDTAGATKTQDSKLTASDGAASDNFGFSAAISGTSAIVGANLDDDDGSNSGSAYLFRNLDTAGATKTQDTKLTASDGAAFDEFGRSVAISGTSAVVGAPFDDDKGPTSGSAYLFRNLDVAGATKTEDAKLLISDGEPSGLFGWSVSLSENTALIGAPGDNIGGSFDQGSALLYLNLDTASGTVTETVKIFATDRTSGDEFGSSVGLDGDQFVIGARLGNGLVGSSGNAYSGTVSSLTTLDSGNASRTIDGISFATRTDWIIGETTDSNQVTLTGGGDTVTVTETGKAVYVGKEAGSDNNTLVIEGFLIATQVNIGATGNIGNKLLLGGGGANSIQNATSFTMTNGTFATDGLSETVGTLISSGVSIIDLGHSSSVLRFADSSSLSSSWAGLLNVYNWTGSYSGGGMDQLYFGTSASGLTTTQLAQIYFYNDAGLGLLGPATILSTGEVVPLLAAIPEPNTIAAALLLGSILLWRERRRVGRILRRD